MNSTRYSRLAALTAAALLALTGCSKTDAGAATEQPTSSRPSGQTLSQAIAGASNLSDLSGALRATGLAQVFDGAGSYTILAPNNAAFAKLGDAGSALDQPDDRSQMAAELRDHIVPGYMTPADIRSAIDSQHGEVKVATMGGHKLSFTSSGNAIKVTGEDGSEATISGDAVEADNGVAIPVDGVLKKLTPSG